MTKHLLLASHPEFDDLVGESEQLRVNPLREVRLGLPAASQGEQWHSIGSLADPEITALLLGEFRKARGIDHTAAAAVAFLRNVVQELIYAVVGTVYLGDRCLEVSPSNVQLRWRPDLGVDGLALDAEIGVAAVGPALRRHVISLADRDALDGWAAERLVGCVSPVIEGIRGTTRVGSRLLWGYVSDLVHFRMLSAARDTDRDRERAWSRAEHFAARLTNAGAAIRSHPRPVMVDVGQRNLMWAVRGVCCLVYRADPDHGYCTTCPLQSEDVREQKLRGPKSPVYR